MTGNTVYNEREIMKLRHLHASTGIYYIDNVTLEALEEAWKLCGEISGNELTLICVDNGVDVHIAVSSKSDIEQIMKAYNAADRSLGVVMTGPCNTN